MPEILTAFIPYAALIAVYMTAWFVVALIRKDNSIADIAWGLGFVLIAAVSLLRRGDRAGRPVLARTLIFIWGLRLAIHIVIRNRKRGEDSR